ncbi:unnamed protein product [Clavelina lepadiformis]|uniref:Uncharacterized protein n=1 Tax=Clavelina lepadiformis TaxID=159417 RepID=A0ABP0GZ72_CLALP
MQATGIFHRPTSTAIKNSKSPIKVKANKTCSLRSSSIPSEVSTSSTSQCDVFAKVGRIPDPILEKEWILTWSLVDKQPSTSEKSFEEIPPKNL